MNKSWQQFKLETSINEIDLWDDNTALDKRSLTNARLYPYISLYLDKDEMSSLSQYFWIDLAYSTAVPFGLMFIFSFLLLFTIFNSRMKAIKFNASQSKRRVKKDIKFTLSCVVLNANFILFCLPVCISNILSLDQNNILVNKILICIFYLCFSIEFYSLFVVNSVYRKEVLVFLNYKQSREILSKSSYSRRSFK